MPAVRPAVDRSGRMGVVVVPRQLQYIELVEDHKFPPIRMMHNAEEAENEGYRVPFPLHGAQRKRQSIKTRPTSTFTAASINELQDNLMESIATPCPVEVSGLITGKEAGLHTADPKKRRKKKSNMKELHTELLMGRQTGDYARHRAEQLEKFRGTPEPLLFRDFAKDHFMDHPSKGSAMGQRQSAYGAERLQSLPGHSPVPAVKTGWRSPSPIPDTLPIVPTLQRMGDHLSTTTLPSLSPLLLDLRSISPLRDASLPYMGHPDEGRRGIILDPATLANERDRSTSPPHPMPRSTAIVQDDLDAVMELVKLQAPPPTTSLVPVRGREAMPSAFKPYHKIEATAPPNTKASWLPNNSQPLSGSAQSDVKFNQARRSLNVQSREEEPAAPPPPAKHSARKSKNAFNRRLEQPDNTTSPDKKARMERQRMLGAHQTATATRVLDKLEDLSDRAADALANEIAEEKERLKQERNAKHGGVDQIQKNIEMCALRVDRPQRLAEKMQHFENVRQRAKHLDTEFQAKKEYAAKRSERLEAAAARKKYEAEQQARVQQLAPILKIVSMLSGLGNQLNEHRAKLQARSLQAHQELRLMAVLTLQRIFRGFRARKAYKATRNAAITLQTYWRSIFVWRVKLLKQKAGNKVVEFIRDVHNQSDFIGAIKVAIHRIVKENRRKTQMKTLSKGIMTTVLRGQWSKAEIEEIARRREITRVKNSRFMMLLSTAITSERGLQGGPDASPSGPSGSEHSATLPPAANAPPPAKQVAPPKNSEGGLMKMQGLMKKHTNKMRSLVGQSMPNASTVLEDLHLIPDLVKQLVVEAFINFRFSQYVRVMGVYWLQKARYNRKKRTFERRKSKVIHPIECKQAPPLPPKLHPMPRGCRAAELKVIMQQGVLETSIMEEEGDWDLSEKRVVPEGEAATLSEKEQARVPEVQERLKKRFFMCNISVKAGLMASSKVGD